MEKSEILNQIIYKWALACLKDVEKKRKVFLIWDCISGCKKVFPEQALKILSEFKQTDEVKKVIQFISEKYKIKNEASNVFKEWELF
jgi:hypothetical protein